MHTKMRHFKSAIFLATFCVTIMHSMALAQTQRLLVLSDNQLMAYELDGELVSSIPIRRFGEYSRLKDLVQLDDGRIALLTDTIEGSEDGGITIYDGKKNTWERITIPGLIFNITDEFVQAANKGSLLFMEDHFDSPRTILRFNLETEEIDRVLPGTFLQYRDFTIGADGFLYVIKRGFPFDPSSILKMNPDTLEVVSTLVSENVGTGVSFDSTGMIYSKAGNAIRKLSSSGELVDLTEFEDDITDLDIGESDLIAISTQGRSENRVVFLNTDFEILQTINFPFNRYPISVAFTDLALSELPQADQDDDTVEDQFDNCVSVANPDQLDSDSNGVGDLCQNDFILRLVPQIASVSKKLKERPKWRINNRLCCPDSTAILSLSDGETTLVSTRPSCSSESRFSEFAFTKLGTNEFSGSLSADTCPTLPLSFELKMAEKLNYSFELGFDDEDQIRLFLDVDVRE